MLSFGLLAALVLALGFGAQHLQGWLAGDWSEIEECRETHWTCESTVGARPRAASGDPVRFKATAKACDEYRAWTTAVRRAEFECSMSRAVIGRTCDEIETRCELPDRPY